MERSYVYSAKDIVCSLEVLAERGRCADRSVRLLPGFARDQDASSAYGATRPERDEGRTVLRSASESGTCSLSRSSLPSRPQARFLSGTRIWWHDDILFERGPGADADLLVDGQAIHAC